MNKETYTTKEIGDWMRDFQNSHGKPACIHADLESKSHGIAAWKARKKGSDDVAWLRDHAASCRMVDYNTDAKRCDAIADRLEALQKRVAELDVNAEDWKIREEMARKHAENLSDVGQSDRPNIGAQPYADGWIPHNAGDPMPCDETERVHIKLKSGVVNSDAGEASWYYWNECGEGTITHWRPAK